MSQTGKQLINSVGLTADSQQLDGCIFIIAKLLERIESDGYSSTGNFVEDLRALCNVPLSGKVESCATIAAIAHRLGAKYSR